MSWTSYQTLPREEQIDQRIKGQKYWTSILNVEHPRMQLWPEIGDYDDDDDNNVNDDDNTFFIICLEQVIK